jgi:hypothetical protein
VPVSRIRMNRPLQRHDHGASRYVITVQFGILKRRTFDFFQDRSSRRGSDRDAV